MLVIAAQGQLEFWLRDSWLVRWSDVSASLCCTRQEGFERASGGQGELSPRHSQS